MAEVADVATDVEYGGRAHPLFHLLAPLVAGGAVWVARAGIGMTYERVAGRTRPIPSDPETSWGQAIVWTAVTATTAAVIEVTVRRIANKRRVREILQRGRARGSHTTRSNGGFRSGVRPWSRVLRWRSRSDQRLSVAVSATLKELADERSAARKAVGSGD